jgi:hypothetical protein
MSQQSKDIANKLAEMYEIFACHRYLEHTKKEKEVLETALNLLECAEDLMFLVARKELK